MLIIFIAEQQYYFLVLSMKEFQRYANRLNEFGYFFRQLDFQIWHHLCWSAKKYGSYRDNFSVIKEEILGYVENNPNMLDYVKHISWSMYNTPQFSCLRIVTLQWLKNLGGIAAIEK
jgi:phosphoserine aminotransferase